MLRTTALRSSSFRITFRYPSAVMKRFSTDDAGSVGGIRPGGSAQGDSFSKREKAAEDKYIREREAEKLKLLRERLKKHEEQLDELEKSIKDIGKD